MAPFLRLKQPYLPTEVDLPTDFAVAIDGGQSSDSKALILSDGKIDLHYDVSVVSPGQHIAKITPVIIDPVEGRIEGPFSEGGFRRKGPPRAPGDIVLSKD